MNRSQLGSRYFSKVMTIPFLRTINCFEINSFSVQHISFNDMKSRLSNRPFAGSGHMVRNKLHWDANDAVGLSKQRNSYQSSPTFLCFESPTASFASQCNLFRTMWPDPAKGLLVANGHFCSGSSWLKVNKIFRSTFCPNHSLTKANIQFFFSRLKWHRFKNSQSQRITE